MNELVKEVMKSEGVSESEALSLVKQAQGVLYDLINSGDFDGAEDVLMDFFGLEPDYLIDII